MADLTAFATDVGLQKINEGELETQANKFVLLGGDSTSIPVLNGLDYTAINGVVWADVSVFEIYSAPIDQVITDRLGGYQFYLLVPYEVDLQKYIHAVAILSPTNELISLARTPVVYKSTGVGGHFVYKIAITGVPNQLVYKATDYVTTPELDYFFDQLKMECEGSDIYQVDAYFNSKGV